MFLRGIGGHLVECRRKSGTIHTSGAKMEKLHFHFVALIAKIARM